MPKKTAIVIHHSLSNWGDVDEIRRWHVEGNGWKDIGYHKVIHNPYPDYRSWSTQTPKAQWDGVIKDGRTPETAVAAAVKEGQMNSKAIHLCLVGDFDKYPPTQKQWETLIDASARLCARHGIRPDAIYYHRDWAVNQTTRKPYKSCPGWNFPPRDQLRAAVASRMQG